MYPRSALIALLAVVAVARVESNYCSRAEKGYLHGIEVYLGVQELQPDQAHWEITKIPNICPSYTHHQGTEVVVCDVGASPVVTLKSLVSGHVKRTGHLQGTAYMYTRLYCYDPYGAPAAEPRPAAARPAVGAASAPGPSAVVSEL